MRRWLLATLSLAAGGCGYVGDPLPPALNIPAAVTDLRAVQRTGQIIVEFTIPSLTTEQLVIRRLDSVDLRIGNVEPPFEQERWAAGAEAIPVERDTPGPVRLTIPVQKWIGRDAVLGVRLVNTRGRFSAWSNVAVVHVTPPIGTPGEVRAESVADGVRVSWQARSALAGVQYRIFRRSDEDKEPLLIGTSDKPEYIDRSVEYGKRYLYAVEALVGSSESERSTLASVVPVDKTAPSTPKGLTAIAGLGTIELAWESNTDADLKGYKLYKAEGEGTLTLLSDSVETPAFSDKAIRPGQSYRYSVSAVDQSGNESRRSEPVEIAAP